MCQVMAGDTKPQPDKTMTKSAAATLRDQIERENLIPQIANISLYELTNACRVVLGQNTNATPGDVLAHLNISAR
jgi:hypothetical protein